MDEEQKFVRCYLYPGSAPHGKFYKVPIVDTPGIADVPDFASIDMGDAQVYRKAVLLCIDGPNNSHEEIVFQVCCTWGTIRSRYNVALFAADNKIMWPGQVAVFRAARGSCSCRLVNMRSDDSKLALWAVQLALGDILDEVDKEYDADIEDADTDGGNGSSASSSNTSYDA